MAGLYVVATPIGNLEDISFRALATLAEADVVLAEDTRVTARLLDRHRLAKKLLTLNEHNEAAMTGSVLERLARGERIALVSDAGTPAISDPGARLVAAARAAGHRVMPVPGASALAAALSVAGLADDAPVLFCGFLPAKPAERRKRIVALIAQPVALALFEAPHRVRECVDDLAAACAGEHAPRTLVIARELSKLHESVHALPLDEAPEWLAADENRRRGEFVLVLHAPLARREPAPEYEALLSALLDELPLAQAVRLACRASGAPRNTVYARALELIQARGKDRS